MSETKLSIVIVSWNVRKDLEGCLLSIQTNPPSQSFETIVVDNASVDGSAAMVEENFSGARLIANDKNRGFAAANNQGIDVSKGQYILLLNPDTVVHSGALDTLVEFMDQNADVGACGPKLLNGDGSIQRSVRHFPSFRGALYRHTIFRSLYVFRTAYRQWMMKDFDSSEKTEVDQIMGAALFVRKTILEEIGNLDENYFMYYEEVDLCYRIRMRGWKIIFLPDAMITHYGGHSSKQVPVEKRMMMLSSLLFFFRKHRGRFVTNIFCILFKPSIIMRDLSELVGSLFKYVIALLFSYQKSREKYNERIKGYCELFRKYTWYVLFKM